MTEFFFSDFPVSEKIVRQRGSVLFLILVAVVLFSALSLTVANMMRSGGEEHIGKQRAGLLADEILAYGRQLRHAVQGLKISNGCDEGAISFEGTGLSGYGHSPAASARCTVFHESGAGLQYIKPVADFGSGTDWVFTGQLNVGGVGTDCASGSSCTELLAVLEGIHLTVCRAINEKLGIVTPDDEPPVQDGVVGFPKFTGDQTYTAAITDQAGNDVLEGQPAGCTKAAAGGNYFFYQTLASR